MPVKVRCSGCEAVLNAPDRARGKAIKCPKCGTRVRVPIGKKKKKQPAGDEGDFLAGIDLDRLEDKNVRLCPRCGAEVSEDDVECPACEADLVTGSRAAARERRRRGPDPAKFYGAAWSDSWRFIVDHPGLLLRTALYVLVFGAVSLACVFLAVYCHRTPPILFWAFLGAVASTVAPGWTWFLSVKTIAATLEKKKQLKRVNFDPFLCMALGLNAIAWVIALAGPALLICAPLAFVLDMSAVGQAVLLGVPLLFALPFVPIGFAHMAMPVKYKGWLSPLMLPALFKNFGACFYVVIIGFIVSIPAIAASSVAGAVWHSDVEKLVRDVRYNVEIEKAKHIKERFEEMGPKDKTLKPEIETAAAKELRELDFEPLIGPGVMLAVSYLLVAFPIVFMAKVYGLFAFYNKRNLDLITIAKQKEYVRKDERPEGYTPPIQWDLIAGVVGSTAVVGAVAGAVIGQQEAFDVKSIKDGIGLGLAAAGALCFGIGALIGAYEGAATEEKEKLTTSWFIDGGGAVMFWIGYFLSERLQDFM